MTVNVVEIAEGGQNGFTHKLPSRMTWPNITFKRGLTQSDALFDWLQKSSGEGFAGNSDKLTRSTGAVTAISPIGDRLRSWEFIDVFPVRWKGPDFVGRRQQRARGGARGRPPRVPGQDAGERVMTAPDTSSVRSRRRDPAARARPAPDPAHVLR